MYARTRPRRKWRRQARAARSVPRDRLRRREDLPWLRYVTGNLLAAGYLSDDLLEAAFVSLEEHELVSVRQTMRAFLVPVAASPSGPDTRFSDAKPEDLALEITHAMAAGELALKARALRRIVADALDARGAPSTSRLAALTRQLGLTPAESRALVMLYLMDSVSALARAVEDLDEGRGMQMIADAIRAPVDAVRRAAGAGGSLQRRGAIRNVWTETVGPRPRFVEPSVAEYLSGAMAESVADYYCERLPEATLSPVDLAVPVRWVDTALAVLRGGEANLLLYGPPGVGKSELARTLAGESGLRPVRVRRRADEDADSFRAAVAIATALVEARRDLLVVDEADALLAGSEKGWLNELFDSHGRSVIWITNTVDAIHPATRRRFDYNIHVTEPGPAERESQWHTLIARHNLAGRICAEATAKFARRYELGPGAVDRCLLALSRVDADAGSALPELLDAHAELVYSGRRIGQSSQSVFDPDLVNADSDLDRIVRAARAGLDGAGGKAGGFSVLVSGAPGTGKSAWAAYLAEQVDAPLLEFGPSDLLSAYVGETEARIADAFTLARAQRAVLLLDEVDALVASRDRAVRSWEVSAVNELLRQLDRHRGIVVCCTNLPERIDLALVRRFVWKTEFREPTAQTRRELVARYFPQVSLNDIAATRLGGLDGLVHADFAIVCRRMKLTEDEPTGDEIVRELKKEVDYRSGPIRAVGFAAG